MANPMEPGGGPPPMPLQDNPVQQGGPPQSGQQPAPAPPTHQQTIAALRHFDAVKGELVDILRDPAVGKSDVKSKIIDGVTKLVGQRMMTPAQAVVQLSQVPADPQQQRKWLQTMLAQNQQAENVVLDHYGQGNPSLGDVAGHIAGMDHGSMDDHMHHMAAIQANYAGPKNG